MFSIFNMYTFGFTEKALLVVLSFGLVHRLWLVIVALCALTTDEWLCQIVSTSLACICKTLFMNSLTCSQLWDSSFASSSDETFTSIDYHHSKCGQYQDFAKRIAAAAAAAAIVTQLDRQLAHKLTLCDNVTAKKVWGRRPTTDLTKAVLNSLLQTTATE